LNRSYLKTQNSNLSISSDTFLRRDSRNDYKYGPKIFCLSFFSLRSKLRSEFAQREVSERARWQFAISLSVTSGLSIVIFEIYGGGSGIRDRRSRQILSPSFFPPLFLFALRAFYSHMTGLRTGLTRVYTREHFCRGTRH